MNSPISVLWNNILHTFQNIDPSSLSMHLKAIDDENLNREIDYDNSQSLICAPHADLDTRRIYIQETYLEHLWAFIYSVFVIYEEGVQKPMINNIFSGQIDFDSPVLRRAKSLYDWSVSLADQHSDWDIGLPNPDSHFNTQEKFYAEKVNGIFQKSVAYLMFHEFCHLTQGHDSFYLGTKLCDLTDADYAERIQMENEADDFAFNMIVNDDDNEGVRWVNGLSIIFVKCSSLLITHSASGVKQRSHPDLDSRLLKVLVKLDLTSDNAQFYCWYLCCLAVRFFLIKHEINESIGEYETAQEAFFSYLEMFDKIKGSNVV